MPDRPIATVNNRNKPLTEDERLPSAVSRFLSEGTFSGADIKVLVHYDNIKAYNKDLQAQRDAIWTDINNKSQQLTALDGAIGNAHRAGQKVKASLLSDERQRVEEQILVLSNLLDDVDQKIANIDSLPATKVLGELQTISYSVNREKFPVRTLGSVYPRSFVRGPRTIGGTMIFTIFYEHVLHEILGLDLGVINTGAGDYDRNQYTTAMPDQLPPLNLSIVFANEYGAVSHMALYGVEFMLEGSTFSIHDMYSENTVTYVARDMDPMHSNSKRKIDTQGVTNQWSTKASDLSNEVLRKKGTRLRRNPFI